MARQVNRLNARAVATLSKAGRHADGGGLYLSISHDGRTVRRRWVFLYRRHGKLKEMGLGPASTVSLAQARELAAKWRSELAAGRDPLAAREAERRAQAGVPTFGDMAQAFYEAKSHDWRNGKVRKQWLTPLRTYAAPILSLPVNEIGTEDVLAVLKPIWTKKPETASRVRGRVEAVLDAARVSGHIPANEANPARWRGHLFHLLSKRKKLSRGHHAAMPYHDVPTFVGRLREREAVAALALEFLILTASRTSEVLGARWAEMDMEARVWTIPAERMKGGREHRVPLSARGLEILTAMQAVRTGAFVFPSARPRLTGKTPVGRVRRRDKSHRAPENGGENASASTDRPLSTMALEMLLRRMKVENATVHGFRSSFRDWAGDATHFPRELAEAALAHVAGDATERAYRRGDALDRRRELMDAWARHLEGGKAGNVVPLLRAHAGA
ncbi:MAG: integrase arm-type DNA-binding domain-containing protein [Pseudomonadota bacterium]